MSDPQLRPQLPPAQLRELTRITPGRTPLRVLGELAVIATTIALAARLSAWWLYPVAALIIATRQHALLTLVHECSHFRATQRRWLNDVLGEALAWPFLMTMRGYRRHHHQAHHVEPHINTLLDPDFARKQTERWRFPMPRARLLRLLLADVALLNLPELFQEAKAARNNVVETRADAWVLAARLAFYLSSVVLLSLFGGWRVYLLYWLLPSLTLLKGILRIRSIVDHFSLPDAAVADPTRTVLAPWWERLILAPCNIGIHHAHHAYSAIPYYRLPAAHRTLAAQPGYPQRVRVSRSYWSALWQECCPAEVRA